MFTCVYLHVCDMYVYVVCVWCTCMYAVCNVWLVCVCGMVCLCGMSVYVFALSVMVEAVPLMLMVKESLTPALISKGEVGEITDKSLDAL